MVAVLPGAGQLCAMSAVPAGDKADSSKTSNNPALTGCGDTRDFIQYWISFTAFRTVV